VLTHGFSQLPRARQRDSAHPPEPQQTEPPPRTHHGHPDLGTPLPGQDPRQAQGFQPPGPAATREDGAAPVHRSRAPPSQHRRSCGTPPSRTGPTAARHAAPPVPQPPAPERPPAADRADHPATPARPTVTRHDRTRPATTATPTRHHCPGPVRRRTTAPPNRTRPLAARPHRMCNSPARYRTPPDDRRNSPPRPDHDPAARSSTRRHR
jgi:hypothetical protein